MENKFLKGILTVLAYYATGALLAFIVYQIFGHPYIHAPALHHIILFAVWLGGCAWILFSLVNRFMGKNVAYNRGAALANIIVCSAAFVVVYQDIHSYQRKAPEAASPKGTITTEFSGDTAIVRHDGNIVFLRVGDSVYFDELSKIYPSDSVLNK